MNRTPDLRSLLAPCALAAGIGALAGGIGACGGASSDGPQAMIPERQAAAEYDLSRDAFYRGHIREALDHVRKADSLDDHNDKALYFTAVIYLGFCAAEGEKSPDCRYAEAEDFARRAMKVNPEFRDARNTLGQILILEKKYAEAITILEPLTKDPAYVANYLAWGNYGWAQVLSGKVDDGITSLRNSVTEPRFCTGHYRLGMAYLKKGDYVAAEKSFSDAVQVPSADCQAMQVAWSERGHVRMKLGNAGDARRDFARCREISAKTDTGVECARLAGGAQPTPLQPLAPPQTEQTQQGVAGGVAPAPQPPATADASQPPPR